MPAKTAAQFNLMQAVLHGNAKKKGLSRAVAKEYVDKTSTSKRHQFSKKKKG